MNVDLRAGLARTRGRGRGLASGAIVALLATGLLAAAPVAAADVTFPAYPDWKEAIVDYAVDVQVQANADMVITERITWNAGTQDVRHGLIRDIPTIDQLGNGLQREYHVDLLSVTRDGGEVPYTADEFDGVLSLRIGDENVEITGLHEFDITYRVRNGLDVLTAEDLDANAPPEVSPGDVELYWDFIGDQWAFPIYQGQVSIVGPAPALAARCYAADSYSGGCEVNLNGGAGGATTMEATSIVPPMEAGVLTGVIAWSPEAFEVLPAPVIVEAPQDVQDAQAARNFSISGPLALLALLVPIVLAIVFRRRSKGVVLAASPVRFEP
ncbi:MAG: DUF2207 domain-containing protein, partial [Actinomycetales bacterium]